MEDSFSNCSAKKNIHIIIRLKGLHIIKKKQCRLVKEAVRPLRSPKIFNSLKIALFGIVSKRGIYSSEL